MPREYHQQKIHIKTVGGEVLQVYRYMAQCKFCIHFRYPAKRVPGHCKLHNMDRAMTQLACSELRVDVCGENDLALATAHRDGELTKLTVGGETYYATADELKEIFEILGVD